MKTVTSQAFGKLSFTLGRQLPTPRLYCKTASRRSLSCCAFVDNGNGNDFTGSNGSAGLPLSMFTPYKQLPPDGEVVPAADAACDPTVQNCKTPIYTYESKCSSCTGTGFMKSHANGRRASLCTCLLCHGLGYVRRTTARFAPELGDSLGTYTLARPVADSKSRTDKGKRRNSK